MNICPLCAVEMSVGIAINPTKTDAAKHGLGLPEPLIDYEMLRLDNVWKCPRCGHSADILPEDLSENE